jgi:hypothetical protein
LHDGLYDIVTTLLKIKVTKNEGNTCSKIYKSTIFGTKYDEIHEIIL